MDAFETARRELDRRGLIDPARVGIMGFSRSSWIVDFTITHSAEPWGAAVSCDSGIYNYGASFLGDKILRAGMAAMYGGPPSGETFQAWLEYAPAFSARRVRTPLLMQYHNKVSIEPELYSALLTRETGAEFVLFSRWQTHPRAPATARRFHAGLRGLVPLLAARLRKSSLPISGTGRALAAAACWLTSGTANRRRERPLGGFYRKAKGRRR